MGFAWTAYAACEAHCRLLVGRNRDASSSELKISAACWTRENKMVRGDRSY